MEVAFALTFSDHLRIDQSLSSTWENEYLSRFVSILGTFLGR